MVDETGRVSETLAALFSSRVRASVLAHLLPRPHLGFGLTDLSRVLGLPISSLQHECYKLVRIGVLKGTREGAVRRYRPDPSFPLLAPLTALILREVRPAVALAAAAEGVAGIEVAFLAGTIDAGRATTLVVVGSLDVESLDAVHERAGAVLAALDGQPPHLAFFPPGEWRRRLASDDPLARSLLESAGFRIVAKNGAIGG